MANREKYSMLYPSLSSKFKIFIIGGLQIYERFLPLCQTVWVTYIKTNYHCDLVFDYDFEKQFKETIIEEDDSLKIVEYVAKKL
jgi:dihydrofolate reductase